MATAAKSRRTTSRKRSKKAEVKKLPANGRKSADMPAGVWLRELLSIIFAVLSLFLLASVLSEIFSDGVLYIVGGQPSSTANIMGPVGHLLAVLLIGFMGWCALLPGTLAAVAAGVLWVQTSNGNLPSLNFNKKSYRIVGLFGAMFSLCLLAALFGGEEAGGALGISSAELLLRYFGKGGASLFAVAMILLFSGLTIQKGVIDLLRVLFKASTAALKFSFVKFPVIAYSGLCRAGSFLGSVIKPLSDFLTDLVGGWLSFESEGEDVALPKPRARKKAFTFKESEDEGTVQTSPRKLKSKVLVKRRRPDGRDGERSLRKDRKKIIDNDGVDSAEQVCKYIPPDIKLLKMGEIGPESENDEELLGKSKLIESKLKDFGIMGRVTEVHPGPVITLFEFEPAAGVKVGRIAALQDDMAMSLRASSIRIIAPIPKKGTVGIEVPNRQRDIVRLRDVLESKAFINAESSISVPIGKDTYGDPVVADISTMPHLLMAGATGTGKSVCINALLISFLYRCTPEELGLILIDPKILELSVYEGIPHLKVPVVTVPRQAKAVLEWAVKEMDRRYRLMQRYGVRSLDGFNRMARGEPDSDGSTRDYGKNVFVLGEEQIVQDGTVEKRNGNPAATDPDSQGELPFAEVIKPLPKVVIVIDELADLMLSVGRDIEDLVTRLAQKARAAGIHLILATQRPSVDVITGLIKANFPARLSFRVSSRIDSRTILDCMGAERLLGRGDMLLQLPGAEHLKRVHGAYVSDHEVQRVIDAVKKGSSPVYDSEIMEFCEKALEEEKSDSGSADQDDEYDALYDKAVQLVLEKGQASTSMLQRAFRIGYNRAARIIDTMERERVVGPADGSKPRQLLVGGIEMES